MAKIDLITREDLKKELDVCFSDLSKLINNKSSTDNWVRSNKVKELLGVSDSTLQTLRSNGTLPCSKLGGIIFYDLNEINKILLKNRIHNK